jgi:hypothetical protein
MARGMTREQLGVTDAMLATFGETVFRMSHNLQTREGDPVRRSTGRRSSASARRWASPMGRSRRSLGLTREQVMFIRNSEESRRFRTGQTAYLLDLGGGQPLPPGESGAPGRPLQLRRRRTAPARGASSSTPSSARRYVERGWWGDDTLPRWLARSCKERPDAPAVVSLVTDHFLESAGRASAAVSPKACAARRRRAAKWSRCSCRTRPSSSSPSSPSAALVR